VFAINFHSLSANKNLIIGNKLRLMSGKGERQHINKNQQRKKQVKFKKLEQVKLSDNEIEIVAADQGLY